MLPNGFYEVGDIIDGAKNEGRIVKSMADSKLVVLETETISSINRYESDKQRIKVAEVTRDLRKYYARGIVEDSYTQWVWTHEIEEGVRPTWETAEVTIEYHLKYHDE